ncbi:MAG: DUF6221 family protein [Mycobacteriaceae bacterium]
MTITEFLLARIAEQKAMVRDPRYIWSLDHPEIGAPEKVLAECEAKRQIVEGHAENDDPCAIKDGDWPDAWGDEPWPCRTIRNLASIYAGHPDYREEWRPTARSGDRERVPDR